MVCLHRLVLIAAASLPLTAPNRAGASDSWHAGASVTARLLLDSNVFLQNVPAPGATLSPEAAPAAREDLLAALAARIETRRALRPGLSLEGSYSPEVYRYARHHSEDHADHRLALGVAGEHGDWSGEFRSSAVLIDGAETAPVFGQRGGGPAIGGEPVRARRSQTIVRSTARVAHRVDGGFWRLAAADSRQDFHVLERAGAGCANYVDRADWSAGVDRGWTLRPDLTFLAGARAGAMNQADLLGVRLNHSNRFVRPLLGLEGAPLRGLRLTVLAGPDLRRFGRDVAPGLARTRTSAFVDAAFTWTPGRSDRVSLVARRQLVLASGGRGSYFDSLAELSWRHQAKAGWSWTGLARCQAGDNTTLVPASPRHDRICGGAVTLTRNLGRTVRLEAGVARDWGRSLLPAMPGRAYDRWTESLGVTRSW